MRKPLKGGAVNAQPKMVRARPPRNVRNRRIAGLAVGVTAVVTAGILSTMFVGYLADRALQRAANAPRSVASIEAQASDNPSGQTTVEQAKPAAAPIIEGIPVPTQAAAKPQAATGEAASKPVAAPDEDVAAASEQPTAELAFADSKPAAKKPPVVVKENNPADATYTAAIPTARPEPDAAPKPAQAAVAAEPTAIAAKPDAAGGGATPNGRIIRAVTMRSGPDKGAGAIGTIPAKSAVTIVSCKSWCEVVYNGKKGWIYKGFVDRS